ncbi:MAG: M23 family metallopeptidase [Prolixibacteraceae bacterium]|nr:M23 family metallopeptidase [Prolixibacteraceae bacterium]
MKKIFFSALIILLGFQVNAQHVKKLEISYVEVADGLFDFYATNPNYFPMQVALTFTEFANMDADCELPYSGTVRYGKHKLFTVRRVILDIPGGFQYKFNTRMGAYPVTHNDEAVYRLPVKEGKSTKVVGFDFTNTRTPQKVMWGFEMEAGDTVYAARGGVVAMLTEPRWRDSLRIGDNTVTMLHHDETFGKYELLADSSVVVAVGDTLNAGDPLGKVNVSRFVKIPQVRFSVYYVEYPIDSINAAHIRDIHSYVNPYFEIKGEKRKLEDGVAYVNDK